MKQEIREEQRVITDRHVVYIAEDGKEFDDIRLCKKYEEEIEREKRLNKLSKFIVSELSEQIPINADASFSEYCYYTWFKVNNEKELAELEHILDDGFDVPEQFPMYICYETENEFEGLASDWCYTIEESMDVTKAYFKKFGIDVEFKR